jgi:hypothetical protein
MPLGFQDDESYSGIVLDDWDEMIPNEKETTAIAYQFNQPNSEPPQSLLLAVPSQLGQNTGKWQWKDLIGAVRGTLAMAKTRAVDLDALKRVGCFLPALYLPVEVVSQPSVTRVEGEGLTVHR